MNIAVSAKLHYSNIFLLKDFSLKRIWERLEYPEGLRLKTLFISFINNFNHLYRTSKNLRRMTR